MGFDNECILNIQSLAGEYFCPVCRLLVYPNEALQSQCTHLYCKPCLTYVVSTTQACPYDGYLVTEADAKPLTESNKALAETIGKIPVHCLFHRSGCTWQGPLSECTPHCSGCAFGNSPVVCNRCGVQIVHRQVQEHGQTCPGVQPAQQAQSALDTSASGTSAATADQTQAAIQTGIPTSQALVSQTTTAPGSDPNQKANSSSQSQAAVPSADQWYQQQQPYQQYYQQYPGYDPYQQQYQSYYPYQQPAVPQSQQAQPPYGTVQNQPQTYLQPQPQTQLSLQPPISQAQAQAQAQPRPQIQPPNGQAPIAAQTQNQVQANQQQQVHPTVQTYPAAHGQQQPYYQAPPHSQPHPQQVQVPPYQQPQIQQHTQAQLHPQHHSHSQSQPQPQAQAQHQPQLHPSQPMNAAVQPQAHPSSHAVSGNNSYPLPHLYQPVQSGAPQQHTMHVQSQGMPHSQLQTHVQVQGQLPQQPPLVRPPSSLTTIPNQQQPALLPSPGQVQNIKPAQQQPVPSYAQQPGNLVYKRPLMQAIQQPMLQQYFHHQAYVQQQPSTQLRPQGQSHSFPQHNDASMQSQQNIALSQGIQHTQSNLVGRPMMPSHAVQPQPYAQTAGQVRPMHPSVNHPSTDQNNVVRTNNPVQSGANSRPTMSERQTEKESESSNQKVANGDELKYVNSEMGMKSADDEHKPSGEDKPNQGDTSSKEIPESRGLLGADRDFHALENGEFVGNPTLKKEGVDSTMEHSSNGKLGEAVAEVAKEILSEEAQLREEQGQRLQKDEGSQAVSTSAPTGQVQAGGSAQPSHPVPIHHGPTILPQRPGAPPSGPPHHTQGPGHPLTHLRPQRPSHVPRQPFHPSEHLQLPGANPGFGPSSGRGGGHYGPQGVLPPSHTGAPRMQGEPVGGPPFGGMMARAAPYGPDGPRGHQRPAFQIDQGAIGQPSGIPPNMLRMNGTPGLDPSSTHGLRDERFKAFPDERLNPFPVDPTFRGIDRVEFEDDLKRFPRPSYLDSDPVSNFGNSSSRPFDRGPHGPKYDIGQNTDPVAGDIGRMEPSRSHPDFVGRHLMDGLAPRSPVRDYPGIPSHGFRGFGPDDFDRREFHRFGDPHGNSFREGRLSNFPGHFRRGEFEGPGNMRTVDGHPGHLRRGDHLGPQNLHSHLHLREPMGFGDRHSRLGDMTGPGNFESFRGNRPSHPRLGEPGFRSSFSLQRFPTDGAYTGDLESFDHSRKRKPASMGWCRICKVDCETVEGLDLHSQTREHQKMAMEMVRSIKQNAKKQKLTSGDQSLVEGANKSKSPALKAEEKSIDG
ncbi:hypothetical protein TB2_005997 [Malus domestica]|uniref:uncharacterized protein LOC126589104 n=1 Tax=Malus sylvestris TaxID=3752 RepID=UPI0021AD4023|nr:uncharacterized protein LOC126589104 [Malus sylvestris]XP_050110260.1 uncharacterized protein LOC126589104 [Malus sylvestris]